MSEIIERLLKHAAIHESHFPFDDEQRGWADDLRFASVEICRLRARVAELESNDGDVFTGQLVEIDGHTYGLRPGAARIVKEALRDAGRYRWLRQPNALERAAHIAVLTHNGGYVATEGFADAAIDAAMAKDGAP